MPQHEAIMERAARYARVNRGIGEIAKKLQADMDEGYKAKSIIVEHDGLLEPLARLHDADAYAVNPAEFLKKAGLNAFHADLLRKEVLKYAPQDVKLFDQMLETARKESMPAIYSVPQKSVELGEREPEAPAHIRAAQKSKDAQLS
jgi:hypothetical protein